MSLRKIDPLQFVKSPMPLLSEDRIGCPRGPSASWRMQLPGRRPASGSG